MMLYRELGKTGVQVSEIILARIIHEGSLRPAGRPVRSPRWGLEQVSGCGSP
jgi:hypothetical protein